jgi:hypothetical protein
MEQAVPRAALEGRGEPVRQVGSKRRRLGVRRQAQMALGGQDGREQGLLRVDRKDFRATFTAGAGGSTAL